MSNKLNTDLINEFVKERILVYLKKNKDYGDSFLISLTKFGDTSALVRMDDKVNRYLQLSRTNVNAEVNDESRNDTLLDLFNYAMMFKAFKMDGARILLEDLVESMVEEARVLIYESGYNNSFIYELLMADLEVPEREAIIILDGIKNQIQPLHDIEISI